MDFQSLVLAIVFTLLASRITKQNIQTHKLWIIEGIWIHWQLLGFNSPQLMNLECIIHSIKKLKSETSITCNFWIISVVFSTINHKKIWAPLQSNCRTYAFYIKDPGLCLNRFFYYWCFGWVKKKFPLLLERLNFRIWLNLNLQVWTIKPVQIKCSINVSGAESSVLRTNSTKPQK